MVYEQREHHESQWAAIESVAQKIGCTAQTLRNWIAKRVRPMLTMQPVLLGSGSSNARFESSSEPMRS